MGTKPTIQIHFITSLCTTVFGLEAKPKFKYLFKYSFKYFIYCQLVEQAHQLIIVFIGSVKLNYVSDVFPFLRPGSDAVLFMSRTKLEFGPTQINKRTPVDSEVEFH